MPDYDYKYIQSVRDGLMTDSILERPVCLAVTLSGMGYPHILSEMPDGILFDSIKGDNFLALKKSLIRMLVKLESKVKGAKPLDDEFQLHRTFKDVKNRDITYIPLTIEFDDGQVLTGLARHYGKDLGSKLNRDEFIKITRWFLNEQDITSQVYATKEDVKDEAKAINNIASIISFNSKRFKKEIDSMEKLEDELDMLSALEAELIAEIEELSTASAEEVVESQSGEEDDPKEGGGEVIDKAEEGRDVDNKVESTNGQPDIKSDLDSEYQRLLSEQDAEKLMEGIQALDVKVKEAGVEPEFEDRLVELTDLVTILLKKTFEA